MALQPISTPLTTSAIDDLRNIKMALDESSIVAITNKAGMITYVNDKFCSISQYSEDELIGKTHRIINSGYHPKSFFKNMWATILAKQVWQGEVKNRAKDGSEYWTSTTIVPFLDSAGNINQLISIRQDITARVKAEADLAEALLRWHHPIEGIISPVEFIPIAEKNGFIIPIGQWVLAESVRQAKIWSLMQHPITVSVNVSILQLTQSDFVDEVRLLLKQHQLEPQLLNLEITERMTTDIQFMSRVLHELKEIGVCISIDDFGTGYSSLRYLSQLPIHTVKIDQSFIRDLTHDNQSIIKTIIQLAHTMGLSVVAEGVETEEQEQFLIDNLCHELQGYLYSRPMPLHVFQQFLDEHPYTDVDM